MDTRVCTCTPGTEINGWHETRCPDCHAIDMEAWANAMHAKIALMNYTLNTKSS